MHCLRLAFSTASKSASGCAAPHSARPPFPPATTSSPALAFTRSAGAFSSPPLDSPTPLGASLRPADRSLAAPFPFVTACTFTTASALALAASAPALGASLAPRVALSAV